MSKSRLYDCLNNYRLTYWLTSWHTGCLAIHVTNWKYGSVSQWVTELLFYGLTGRYLWVTDWLRIRAQIICIRGTNLLSERLHNLLTLPVEFSTSISYCLRRRRLFVQSSVACRSNFSDVYDMRVNRRSEREIKAYLRNLMTQAS
jgi:hypothetical protein